MKHLQITTLGLVGTALLSTTAFAGGLDRATFNSSLLYQKGTYMEMSYANTNPEVAPSNAPGLSSDWEVGSEFDTVQFGFKDDVTEKLTFGLTMNSNPFGVDVDYSAFGGPYAALSSLRANLSSRALTAMAKYQINDRVSAFGAIKHQSVKGSANVSVPLTAGKIAAVAAGTAAALGRALTPAEIAGIQADPANLVDGDTTLTSASDVNFIVGAAYEIPEIALRVAASYESAADFAPDVLLVNSGLFNTGAGGIKTPKTFLLEFQSGVAENTLVFGSIRHAKWKDAQVTMSALFNNAQLSDFDNSTTYTLGVGRKFSDSFSGSLSLTHAPSDCDSVSLLAPTCTQNTLNIGGKYSVGNGVDVSGGVSLRKYDDATSSNGIVFGGNTLMTVGLKLAKTF